MDNDYDILLLAVYLLLIDKFWIVADKLDVCPSILFLKPLTVDTIFLLTCNSLDTNWVFSSFTYFATYL